MKTTNEQTTKTKPPYPVASSASCCQRKDVWLQAWANPRGFCESGCSGAHLSYYWTYGCEVHQQYDGKTGGEVDRYCPQDCAWSKALD
jgi:hypothetical protein